ncbi:MAG TPA: hypothetical protein DDW81_00450, partial [Cryomorphaceae bacterium]|nr:hypothetical protein [Cryomorphaceae bacterium]
LPLCFTLLFASLYQNLNPIFADYFKRTLDMIDFSLLITIALGIAVISIAILQVIPERILLLDRLFGNNFNPEGTSSSPNNIERQGGIILFSLLNITLFIFLLSDVFFLQDIWQGVADEYAHYVHQGVGLLIFSIVIATALILYYFRNAENALLPGRNALKILAITWVFLNIGITCSTAAKNLLYVGEYSLSLKRIGVFIYLLLALTGLVVTLVKLYKRKTNAFLIRQVYWSFFILLTLNICIDWSTTVVRYNIHQHIKYGQELDWAYLLRMDTRTLPQVDAHRNEIKINDKKEQDEFRERLAFKRGEATQYAPDWREMHVARLYAQSYYIQP